MPEGGGRELETEIGFWSCKRKRKKRTSISEEEEEEEVLKVKQDLQLCMIGAQEIQSIICLCGREVVLATIKAKQQIVFILSKRSDERETERWVGVGWRGGWSIFEHLSIP
jgi:hypothetical protein